jgi:hypothetical protein
MFDDLAPPPSVADVCDSPDGVAAELAVHLPGPEGAVTLSMLDPAALSPAGRVDLLVAIERQLAWLAATQQRVLATMAGESNPDDSGPDGAGWVREDVSCALRLSGISAQRRLAVAGTLDERLPATLTQLRRGAISYLHAMSLAESVYNLDAKASFAVEERVLPRAPEQTLAQFRRSVRRAVARVSAATVEQQRAEAMRERRVCVTARDDGMAELWAVLPAEGAAAIMGAIDALASVTSADDQRTVDHRRADALVDLGVAALHDPLLPRAQGMRPAVQVTVALSSLLGLDDQPGELSGHGPVPATVARRIAADPTGTWRRLITDPVDGSLLDYGRSTYRPPADLADFVMARDGTCAFPTCNRAAHRCDLDHRVVWEQGGRTNAANLQPLCRRHHRLKHQGGWELDRTSDGRYRWISPTRHIYHARAPELAREEPSTVPSNADPPF